MKFPGTHYDLEENRELIKLSYDQNNRLTSIYGGISGRDSLLPKFSININYLDDISIDNYPDAKIHCTVNGLVARLDYMYNQDNIGLRRIKIFYKESGKVSSIQIIDNLVEFDDEFGIYAESGDCPYECVMVWFDDHSRVTRIKTDFDDFYDFEEYRYKYNKDGTLRSCRYCDVCDEGLDQDYLEKYRSNGLIFIHDLYIGDVTEVLITADGRCVKEKEKEYEDDDAEYWWKKKFHIVDNSELTNMMTHHNLLKFHKSDICDIIQDIDNNAYFDEDTGCILSSIDEILPKHVRKIIINHYRPEYKVVRISSGKSGTFEVGTRFMFSK